MSISCCSTFQVLRIPLSLGSVDGRCFAPFLMSPESWRKTICRRRKMCWTKVTCSDIIRRSSHGRQISALRLSHSATPISRLRSAENQVWVWKGLKGFSSRENGGVHKTFSGASSLVVAPVSASGRIVPMHVPSPTLMVSTSVTATNGSNRRSGEA